MRHLSAVITIISILLVILLTSTQGDSPAAIFVAACNSSYCNNRGNGSFLAGATDNCSCDCTWPYFGLQCISEYTTAGVSVLIDCNTRYGTDQAMCNASAGQCYWNATMGACASKYGLSTENATAVLQTSQIQGTWCYQIIALPYALTVYCLATIAFGIGSMGTIYMLRYRNTYSVLEQNGERMFNQYYETRVVQYFTLLYCFLLCASSGLLAVTAFINFQNPSICIYVYFFMAYCAVQALCILWPIAWCIQFMMKYFESSEKKRIDLDTQVKPKKFEREYDRRSCQLKCF